MAAILSGSQFVQLEPFHVLKLLLFIWRLGAHRLNLRTANIEMRNKDGSVSKGDTPLYHSPRL